MKIIWLSLVLLMFHSLNTFSQNPTDTAYSNISGTIIKVYPLQLTTGEFRLGIETPLQKNVSFEAALGYLYWGAFTDNWAPDDDAVGALIPFKISYGITARVGLKFYGKSKKNYGLYFSPLIFAKYVYYHINYNYGNGDFETDKEPEIGVQALVGYKYATKHRVSFDIYAGLGVKHGSNIQTMKLDLGIYTTREPFSYPCLPLGFTVGYLLNKK